VVYFSWLVFSFQITFYCTHWIDINTFGHILLLVHYAFSVHMVLHKAELELFTMCVCARHNMDFTLR
jgi:hypothetical protein